MDSNSTHECLKAEAACYDMYIKLSGDRDASRSLRSVVKTYIDIAQECIAIIENEISTLEDQLADEKIKEKQYFEEVGTWSYVYQSYNWFSAKRTEIINAPIETDKILKERFQTLDHIKTRMETFKNMYNM